jgi:hypothetical protein
VAPQGAQQCHQHAGRFVAQRRCGAQIEACKAQVLRQRELALQFPGRTQGDLDEPREIGIGGARRSLGNIADDRYGSPPHLQRESVPFLSADKLRDPINFDNQLPGARKDTQFVVISHGLTLHRPPTSMHPQRSSGPPRKRRNYAETRNPALWP